MKRVILFLCFNLHPAITLLAEKDYSIYGRREDHPFISPMELIGGIILIVGGYWLLRGFLSVLSHIKGKTLSWIIAVIAFICLILFIDNQPHSHKTSNKVEQEVRRQILEQKERKQAIEKAPQSLSTIYEEQIEDNTHDYIQSKNMQIDILAQKQQAYSKGQQKGFIDGRSDGYYGSSESAFLGVLPPTEIGESYNNSCSYDNLILTMSYEAGYDTGYDNGIKVGYELHLNEYKRKQAELEQEKKELYEENKDIIMAPDGGLLDKDGNFLPKSYN